MMKVEGMDGMDWLEAMNEAIDYLEDNLLEPLDIEGAARRALASSVHFHRMYHAITGVTVAEYVRRRRLTLAAQEVLGGAKVLDTALKYGYETPEAFSKAFRKLHGISPSAARRSGARLTAYPKLSFHISIRGDKDMNYKIVEKEAFSIIGKAKRISMVEGENFKLVPLFWNECMQDGSCEWLQARAGGHGLFGVGLNCNKEETDFTYMIAVRYSGGEIPSGYVKEEVPTATWAVFEAVGALPDAVQELLKRIFSEWLPGTGYKLACAPELEVYYPGDIKSPEYRCEIWIPICK